MAERQELTPEQRTSVLLHQDVGRLSVALRNMEIAVVGTNLRIKVDETHPYLIAENDGMYRRGKDGINIDNLPTGTLWALYWPLRKMRLSLITAKEGVRRGACVELVRASRYNPTTGLFVPMGRKGDIANCLELDNNEAVTLQFTDQSNTLYLDRGTRAVPIGEETSPTVVDPEAAERYMRALLGE